MDRGWRHGRALCLVIQNWYLAELLFDLRLCWLHHLRYLLLLLLLLLFLWLQSTK